MHGTRCAYEADSEQVAAFAVVGLAWVSNVYMQGSAAATVERRVQNAGRIARIAVTLMVTEGRDVGGV